MAESLDSKLVEAYELIEANRIDEARTLLTPLLDQYPDEPDLWWVYSHAVDNREEAEQALRRVVELDPSYSEAGEMLEQIQQQEQPAPAIRSLKPPPSTPEMASLDPPNDDDTFDEGGEFDEFEDSFGDDDPSDGPNLILLGAIAAVLILVSAGVLFFALNGNGTDAPTPTSVADRPTATNALGVATVTVIEPTTSESATPISAEANAENATSTPDQSTAVVAVTETEEATETVAATETEEATETEMLTATDTQAPPTETPTPTATNTATPMPTPTVNPSALILEELGDFDLSQNDPTVTETSLGDTLIIEFCLGTEDRSTLLEEALSTIANAPLEDANYDAVAVSLYDCESDETIRIIGVAAEDALAFQEGELDEEAFQLSWTVVG